MKRSEVKRRICDTHVRIERRADGYQRRRARAPYGDAASAEVDRTISPLRGLWWPGAANGAHLHQNLRTVLRQSAPEQSTGIDS